MSSSYSTLTHATPDPSDPVNADAAGMMATIHGLQVDLSILAAWLEHDPEPILQRQSVAVLDAMRQVLAYYAPPVQRH